jgi:hypothetical protein
VYNTPSLSIPSPKGTLATVVGEIEKREDKKEKGRKRKSNKLNG